MIPLLFITDEMLVPVIKGLNSVIDPLMSFMPYVGGALFLLGLPRIWLASRDSKLLTAEEEVGLRVAPFSVSVWVLFLLYMMILFLPHVMQHLVWHPGQRATMEVFQMALLFMIAIGIFNVMVRHGLNPKLRDKFSPIDLGVFGLMLACVTVAIFSVVTMRWSTGWLSAVVAPYLDSLFTFKGAGDEIVQLPWLAKLHVICVFLFFGLMGHSKIMARLLLPVPRVWGLKASKVKASDVADAAAHLSGVSAGFSGNKKTDEA